MFKQSEFNHILAAIIILAVITSFTAILSLDALAIVKALIFSIVIIFINITAKKLTAYSLDSNVTHEIWQWQRFGFKPHQHLKKPIPAGIIFPLFLSIFSLGIIKFAGILTYESRALKQRAARRFGYYSWTEMTDWHNTLIGASGIASLLLLALITYFIPGLEGLPKSAIFYAFSNMLPISKLDGTQILFSSKPLYTVLGILTLIFFAYALLLP